LWLDIGTQTKGVKMKEVQEAEQSEVSGHEIAETLEVSNQWNDETIDAIFNEVNEDEKYDYHSKGNFIEPSDHDQSMAGIIGQDPELRDHYGWE
jgi:hypothetical protein